MKFLNHICACFVFGVLLFNALLAEARDRYLITRGNKAVIDLQLPEGSTVYAAGRVFRRAAQLRYWPLSPGEIKTLPVKIIYPSGAKSEHTLLLEAGCQIKLARLDPGLKRPVAVVQAGHTYRLTGAEFSPDGRMVVTTDIEKGAILWDVETGRMLRFFKAHTEATFSPDGKMLATDHAEPLNNKLDNGVVLWDIQTGEKLKTIHHFPGEIRSIRFTPDGRLLAINSEVRGLDVVEVETGRLLGTFDGSPTPHNPSVLSPDGKLAATRVSGGQVDLYDVTSGEKLYELKSEEGYIGSLSFTPDSRELIGGIAFKPPVVWDAVTGEIVNKLEKPLITGSALLLSPDGKSIMNRTDDGDMRLLDVETGEQLQVFKAARQQGGIHGFTPDGRTVMTSVYDKNPTMVDTGRGKIVPVFHQAPILTPVLWDVETGQRIQTFNSDVSQVSSIDFSQASNTLLATTGDHLIVMDTDGGRMRHVMEQRPLAPRSEKVATLDREGNLHAILSPDGKVALAWTKKQASLWDVESGTRRHQLKVNTEHLQKAMFHSDGLGIAIFDSCRNGIYKWGCKLGNQNGCFSRAFDNIYFVKHPVDGRWVVTRSRLHERTTELRDIYTGKTIRKLEGPVIRAVSPDGKLMVGVEQDTPILADFKTGEPIRSFQTKTEAGRWRFDFSRRRQFGYQYPPRSDSKHCDLMQFSPDGRMLLGMMRQTPIVWDVATGKVLSHFETDEPTAAEIKSAQFSSDGQTIIIRSSDGSVRIWSVSTSELLLTSHFFDEGKEWIAITPDGLYDGSPGGIAQIFFRLSDSLTVQPASEIQKTFYYPGLLAKIMQGERPLPRIAASKSSPKRRCKLFRLFIKRCFSKK